MSRFGDKEKVLQDMKSGMTEAIRNRQYDLALKQYRLINTITHGQHCADSACGLVVSAKEFSQEQNTEYHILQDARDIPNGVMPNFIGQGILLGDNYPRQQSEQYISTIPDATIFGRNNVILTENNLIICDFMRHPLSSEIDFTLKNRVLHYENQVAIVDISSKDHIHLEKGIMVLGVGSASFGHWIGEFFPRLDMLVRSETYKDWPILVDDNMPETHYEMIAIALGNKRKVIRISPDQAVHVHRLATASTISFNPWGVTAKTRYSDGFVVNCKDHFESLRRLILYPLEIDISTPVNSGKRYFVSRRQAGNGIRLLNEKEILDCFIRYGFEPLYPEDLSIVEQIKKFNEAEAVAGCLGSALCLLAMCRSGCRMYMLSNEHLSYHWGWAVQLGALKEKYQITFVAGQAVKAIEPTSFSSRTCPFNVDVAAMEGALANDFTCTSST